MAQLEWFEAVELIRPHVVRILTPQGSGTGFLFSRSANGSVCGIATAAHVVDQAHYWEQPIRLQSADSGQVAVLRPSDRAIILDESRDTAAIAFKSDILALPEEPLDLISTGSYLKVGNPIGWLGYPAISAADLSSMAHSIMCSPRIALWQCGAFSRQPVRLAPMSFDLNPVQLV